MTLIPKSRNAVLLLVATTFLALSPHYADAEGIRIFDAHIHYSHDAVILVPPEQAVELLRKAGISKALVSSSDDNGTQKLHDAAPDIIVPSLRPYRSRGEIGTWMNDPTVIDYVEDRLEKYTYRALGEFHAYGDDIETPVLQRLIALAKEHDLLLHAHSDIDAIDRIFRAYPQARVLWAHSGFDRPEDIRASLRRHKNLWSDLAFRSDHASNGKVTPQWRAAFDEFPDRFMVGTDTFAPERWYYIGDHAQFSRAWLADLPDELAKKIAYENAEKMLGFLQ
jgi:hypothetical protein